MLFSVHGGGGGLNEGLGVPLVMSRLGLNAQRRVQLGVVSLSDPLLCPVGTLAHGNYGDYFLLHSQCSEHPVKG
jgi:hypothetical protein